MTGTVQTIVLTTGGLVAGVAIMVTLLVVPPSYAGAVLAAWIVLAALGAGAWIGKGYGAPKDRKDHGRAEW